MKVIFGGTYDPVHIGHLRMARELVEELSVKCIHLMPCYEAVHKDSVSASAMQRLDMLKLATLDDESLKIDEREVRRGKASYTVDSLREIRQENTDESLCIVMGTDSALSLASWRSVEGFSHLTNIVVVRRPGESQEALEKVRLCLVKLGFALVESADRLHWCGNGLALILELTQLDISSTAIRSLVNQNRSIRYLVTRAVEEYICDNGLYGS